VALETRPAERNPRGQGELLRDRLLDAAVELVAEQGDATRLSIRSVTRRAGVSPTALYLHFENLDELVLALVERGFTEFRSSMHAAVEGGTDPEERLRRAGLAYTRFARERGPLYAVIFGPRPHPAEGAPLGPQVAEDAFGDLVALVTDYVGPDRAAKEDATALAGGVWTGLHGYVTLRHARPWVEWEPEGEFIDRLTSAWLGTPGG
jgi:AcrR family transcriptional regulator